MDKRLTQLLQALPTDGYMSSHSLAEQLHTSYKTIRKRARELDGILRLHGASVQVKPNRGFMLCIEDEAAFSAFAESLRTREGVGAFYQADDRVYFLVEYLVSSDQYIKVEDLCDMLFVSKNTLGAALKKAEQLLGDFHLTLIKKPNHGILCSGTEWHRRLCITHCLVQENRFSFEAPESIEAATLRIGRAVLDAFKAEGRRISELALQNVVQHLYTAEQRVRQGHLLPESILEDPVLGKHPDLMAVSRRIAENMAGASEGSPPFPGQEAAGIAVILASTMNISYGEPYSENLVIQQETVSLAKEMLQIVYDMFKIDLRDNLELQLSICRDLVPLKIRLRYGMKLENPMLAEIKEKYFFSYTLASQSLIAVTEDSGAALSDDEVGYFALLYALALEKGSRDIPKKNILLVCATGKSSAQLLVYKYQEEFGDYIDTITVCDVFHLQDVDFTGIDYVFTTVPIKVPVPVPILEVELFPEERELVQVKRALRRQDYHFLLHYYRQELFFTDVGGETMEQVVAQLCDRVSRHIALPENFEQSVINREYLAGTDFGNFIAFPHPYRIVTEETFVAVCVLPKPIKWRREPVQVVLMVSIGTGENERIEDFYKLTTKFIRSREAVQRVIATPGFETLIRTLGGIALS